MNLENFFYFRLNCINLIYLYIFRPMFSFSTFAYFIVKYAIFFKCACVCLFLCVLFCMQKKFIIYMRWNRMENSIKSTVKNCLNKQNFSFLHFYNKILNYFVIIFPVFFFLYKKISCLRIVKLFFNYNLILAIFLRFIFRFFFQFFSSRFFNILQTFFLFLLINIKESNCKKIVWFQIFIDFLRYFQIFFLIIFLYKTNKNLLNSDSAKSRFKLISSIFFLLRFFFLFFLIFLPRLKKFPNFYYMYLTIEEKKQ